MKNQIQKIVEEKALEVSTSHEVYTKAEVMKILTGIHSEIVVLIDKENTMSENAISEYLALKTEVLDHLKDYPFEDEVEIDINYEKKLEISFNSQCLRRDVQDVFNDFEASIGIETKKD